ncbi:GNAT family acetyltransferase [Demequina sp. B12]|uniref:GNAT family acetyltransferase n=1 Tax=Demequina sp. B12 TaxID=2992757 RepID=UPI00237BAFA4|nr:GNAT family acetyltransferase [Demequina sp. B12]MDE0572854.1 GNAT family acetyltransferase [Demequina sp. B12]
MPVRVRRFAPRDTDAVVELWRECFPTDPARNAPAELIARKCARDPDLFWVACEVSDGVDAVVGAAMAGYDGVRGWLYHVAVTPERRREGIATALVGRAVAELEVLGCPKVNLQVRSTNSEVLGFYRSLGWSVDEVESLGRTLMVQES